MRVMVIASLYSSGTPSGENLFVQNMIKTFKKKKLDSQFFIRDTGKDSNSLINKIKIALIQIFNIGNSPAKAIEQFKPDIIIISNMFPNISTRWIKKCSVPIVYFQHNFRINCIAGTFSREGKECFSCISKNHLQGVKHACYKDSRIASVIASIRIFTRRNYQIEIKIPRIFIALHSEAVPFLQMSGIAIHKLRVLSNYLPELKLKPYNGFRNRWIYCGRISGEKGILDLLQIWPDEHNLDIYGDGPMATKLTELVTFRSNVSFKGKISNAELTTLLDKYIGAVIPSRWREGFPMVVLEYMRVGLPIVTTSGNNVSTIVSKSKSGVEFSAGSQKQLSNAIETVITFRDLFSSNARTHFQNHYSEEIWLKNLFSILDETLAESRDIPWT